jgi:hypothetical protein
MLDDFLKSLFVSGRKAYAFSHAVKALGIIAFVLLIILWGLDVRSIVAFLLLVLTIVTILIYRSKLLKKLGK